MSASPRPRLIVLNGPSAGWDFPITGPIATIGRSPECEVLLDQASISRHHARIEEQGGRFILRDLGSRNGIKVGENVVREATLQPGDVFSVGDVQFRFELPPVAAAAPVAQRPTSPAISPVVQIKSPSTVSAPPTAVPDDGEAAQEGEPARIGLNLKLILSVIIGLVLAIGVSIAAMRFLGGGPRVKQGDRRPVLVRVGESKWVPITGRHAIMVDGEWMIGDVGSFSDVLIDDDTVATVEPYEEGDLLVIGRSGGETTLSYRTDRGNRVRMRILVRGRVDDPIEEMLAELMTEEARKTRARSCLENGKLTEREWPYLALQEYRKAHALLKDIPLKGEMYIEVNQCLTRATAEVEKRWGDLRGRIRVAARNKDRTLQLQLLEDAMKLIPDSADPRYQKAHWFRQRLINEVLAEKAQRGRN